MARRAKSIASGCLLLAAAGLVGCQPEPKPIITGANPTRVIAGEDPAAETSSATGEMARPSLAAPPYSTEADPLTGERITVQYQPPAIERPKPLSEISDKELAAEALARIGPPAVPSLIQALQHRDPQVRREVVRVLMRMGPDAKAAAPELTRLLDDEDELVRKYAVKALGNIGPDAAIAVPALMLDLLQPTPEVPRRDIQQ